VVQTAGTELGCDEKVFQEVLEYGDEASTSGEDSMDGIEQGIPKPSKIIEAFYNEATKHVGSLQQNPKSPSAKKKLKAINDKIREQNEKEDQPNKDQWLIEYEKIIEFYTELRSLVARLKKNPNDQDASQKGTEKERELQEFITKHHYPNWDIVNEWVQPHQEKEKRKENPTENTAPKTSPSTTATTAEWKPGLTKKGERILGMAPTEITSKVTGETCMVKCNFLIEKEGEKNPLAVESSLDIGKKATIGYLQELPESKRNDLRCKNNNYNYSDQDGYVKIKGVAWIPNDKPKIYPQCWVWVEYSDGSGKFPNRSGFQKIWGSDEADRRIEDFFIDNGLEIPWLKRAKRPSAAKRTSSPPRSERPERGRSMPKSPSRGRSSSEERIAALEDQVNKLAPLITSLTTKIDKL
jgi:hypothetical protein